MTIPRTVLSGKLELAMLKTVKVVSSIITKPPFTVPMYLVLSFSIVMQSRTLIGNDEFDISKTIQVVSLKILRPLNEQIHLWPAESMTMSRISLEEIPELKVLK